MTRKWLLKENSEVVLKCHCLLNLTERNYLFIYLYFFCKQQGAGSTRDPLRPRVSDLAPDSETQRPSSCWWGRMPVIRRSFPTINRGCCPSNHPSPHPNKQQVVTLAVSFLDGGSRWLSKLYVNGQLYRNQKSSPWLF